MISFIATAIIAIGIILIIGGFVYWLWYEYGLYKKFKKIRDKDNLNE